MQFDGRMAALAAPRSLLAFAAAGLVLSILIGLAVPVYTDETGWRFLQRAGIDGVDGLFSDICGPNTIVVPPWHLWPVRWFGALANSAFAAPVFVRLAGVACALAWLALTWLLLSRLERDGKRRLVIGAMAFAALGIGTLPFIMVLSRPEQPLILTTLLVVIVTLWRAPAQTGAGLAALKVSLIVVLSVIAQSYHMKGVLYGGVALVAIFACASGRQTLWPRIAGIAAQLAFMALSASYWVGRLSCPGDAKLAEMYASENVASALVSDGNLLSTLGTLAKGLNPLVYAGLALPRSRPMANWLPPQMFSFTDSLASYALLHLAWGAVLLMLVFRLWRFWRAERAAAFADARFLLSGALIGVVMVWSVSQLNRNIYEAAHVLPSITLAFVLASTLPGTERAGDWRKLRRVATAFVAGALVSQAIILSSAAPVLLDRAARTGYLDAQPFSIGLGDYAPVRRSVQTAMEAAGMDVSAHHRRLLVDELTYLALHDHKMPLHRLGVMETWNGTITDPVQYLVSRHSDGVVMACQNMDDRMREMAGRSGNICAISGQTLRNAN